MTVWKCRRYNDIAREPEKSLTTQMEIAAGGTLGVKVTAAAGGNTDNPALHRLRYGLLPSLR